MFSMSIVDSQYRYSTIHPSFYKMWCKKAGHEVQETTAWVNDVAFYFKYNDLWGVIDFADHATRAPDDVKKFPVFKAHYNDNIDYPKNFFPLGPVLTGHRPQPYQLDFLLDNDFDAEYQEGIERTDKIIYKFFAALDKFSEHLDKIFFILFFIDISILS